MDKDKNELPSKIEVLHKSCVTMEELNFWKVYYLQYETEAELYGMDKHKQAAHWVHCVCDALLGWIKKGKPGLDEEVAENGPN